MPASYFIDPHLGVVFSRRWGIVIDAELIEHSRALARDPLFEPTFGQLADLPDVVRFDVTADGITQLAALNPFAKTSRRAAIVNSDVSFGVLRMYQSSVAEPTTIHIAHSLSDALVWLGLDPSILWLSRTDERVFDFSNRPR